METEKYGINFDTEHVDGFECPYCLHVDRNLASFEIDDITIVDVACPKCGIEFGASIEVHITYTAYKTKE